MRTAQDIMVAPEVVAPDLSIRELAMVLLDKHLDGVCVVEQGKLLGVVTSMDLVFRERPVDPPLVIALFDLVVQLRNQRTQEELRKITAVNVGEIMTSPVVTARPDLTLTKLAAMMVDKHLTVVPVVDGEALVGVVTKFGMVRAVLQRTAEI